LQRDRKGSEYILVSQKREQIKGQADYWLTFYHGGKSLGNLSHGFVTKFSNAPRFGLTANEVSTAHAGCFSIAGIAIKQFSSLFTQYSSAFRQRHAHEGSTIRLMWSALFCSFANRCCL
jgi:hypothetical protein